MRKPKRFDTLDAVICLTNTRLFWAVEAARVGLKKNALLAALMANWAVALRRVRYQAVQRWKSNHRPNVRRSEQRRYHRTKVLKGRPPAMTPEERRVHKNKLRRERYRQRIRLYEQCRRRTDPVFALRERLRATLRCAIARQFTRKSARTFELVGCTPTELKAYIEALFAPGMSWANRHLWHVDHKTPISSFDLTNPAQQRLAFHYTNLQPLWAIDNRLKGDRLI